MPRGGAHCGPVKIARGGHWELEVLTQGKAVGERAGVHTLNKEKNVVHQAVQEVSSLTSGWGKKKGEHRGTYISAVCDTHIRRFFIGRRIV